jgi:hypothetical protein
MSKGYSLPVNTTAILVLVIAFVALFFALVSGVVQDEVDVLRGIADENMPDIDGSGSKEDADFNSGPEESRENFYSRRGLYLT